jgi:hypothetical protein
MTGPRLIQPLSEPATDLFVRNHVASVGLRKSDLNCVDDVKSIKLTPHVQTRRVVGESLNRFEHLGLSHHLACSSGLTSTRDIARAVSA